MLWMDDARKWRAVYRLLDQVSTEVFDCGTLCGSACCNQQGAEDMGIYLFPGEHLLLMEEGIMEPHWERDPCSDHHKNEGRGAEDSLQNRKKGWLTWETQDPGELGFPPSWTEPVYFVTCKTPSECLRKWRPLQCRTFPLKPVLSDSGVLELIWNDEDLPYTCPIIENNMPIHDDFYKATYTVWTHLLRDPRIMDLVLLWS